MLVFNRFRAYSLVAVLAISASGFVTYNIGAIAQVQTARTPEQLEIGKKIGTLRSLPDEERKVVTKQIALDIRKLAPSAMRVGLASSLANLATEGDFGRDTLQEVTTTLAEALRDTPVDSKGNEPAYQYVTLAQLMKYEGMKAELSAAPLAAAMLKLAEADKRCQAADFTLNDLQGRPWNLKSLKGKVVLVNFWATWCPPCRKELPDIETLFNKFKDKGFVVLGISDEDMTKVEPFVAKQKLSYPILLDPGRKVNTMFDVQGIPRNFIFDRDGKLAAQAIDMRTKGQFMELLSKVGLK